MLFVPKDEGHINKAEKMQLTCFHFPFLTSFSFATFAFHECLSSAASVNPVQGCRLQPR